MSLFVHGLFSTYNQVKPGEIGEGNLLGIYMGKNLLSSANLPLSI